MRTNKIITPFFMAVSFILIINTGSGHSKQIGTMLKNSDILCPEGYMNFVQEKSSYQFVGAEKCASVCHNNDKMGFQYSIWKSSLHSDAFKILASKKAEKYAKKANVKGNPQESPICLKCHVTGSKYDSSYFTSTYKKDEGVTCESCHKQVSDGKTYLPNESDCFRCHSDLLHKMPKFDFKNKCAKIAHPRPTPIPKRNLSTGLTSIKII
jgi:hypothetical protein